MHLILPFATIATSVTNIKAAQSVGADKKYGKQISKDSDARTPSFSNRQLTSMIESAAEGEECVPSNSIEGNESKPDQGILARCHSPEQVCLPDGSSSIGGRCHDNTIISTGTRQTTLRQLQKDYGFTCLDSCPGDLCTCAESTELGFPDPKDCAVELNAVCLGDSSQCFDKEYLQFYEQTYCEFASCWLGGNPYEDCTCGYYQNYCELYGKYADSYPDVASKCAVAACCDQAIDSEAKMSCLPVLMPSGKPSASPTSTSVPSESLTEGPTGAPTKQPSRGPTAKPTGMPTDASSESAIKSPPINQPSTTSTMGPTKLPTAAPADEPTGYPSAAPTALPTKVPSESPTAQPTESPTAIPTDLPTKTPTSSPTTQPSGSPTEMPTNHPSHTSAPTQTPTSKPSASTIATSKPTATPGQDSDSVKSSSTITGVTPKEPLGLTPDSEGNTYVQNRSGVVATALSVVVGAFWLLI